MHLDTNNLHWGAMSAGTIALFVVLLIWSLIWKGLALWRAARRTDAAWFIIFMFLNTIGILEILYYYVVARSEPHRE